MRREEKRRAIAEALRLSPTHSNSWVGRSLGVSPHTVRKVRLRLEAEGGLATLPTTLGRDGKQRPIRATCPEDDALEWLFRRADFWGHDPLIVKGDDAGFLERTAKHSVIVIVMPPDELVDKYVEKGRRLAYHLAVLMRLDCLGHLCLERQRYHCSLDRIEVLKNTNACWAIFKVGLRVSNATVHFSAMV